jgi:competence protein ComEC
MKKFNGIIAVLLAVVLVVGGAIGGYIGYLELNPLKGETYVDPNGEIEVHFLELGNKYTGDCTYIKAGETDILIDAGSRAGSVPTIKAYVDQFCTDGKLEYVIVTHADQDHIAGFGTGETTDSIFDLYECETVITFALTNKDTQVYKNFQRELEAEVAAGATHLTAAECIQQNKALYELSSGVTMKILDQKFYYEKTSDENDYSVCALFTCGAENILLTGDLEKDGEESLAEMNELPEVALFKAGHHGSPTSSNDVLLSEIKPKTVCVCCCAGSDEYTDNPANQFPSQAMIDRVAPYTDAVYVTTMVDGEGFKSMNGCIKVLVNQSGVTVTCTANNVKLKDTDWFKASRSCPDAWK